MAMGGSLCAFRHACHFPTCALRDQVVPRRLPASACAYAGSVGAFLRGGFAGTGTIATRPPRRVAERPPALAQAPGTVELRTYIVEDNATIRENLIGTLEELASVQSLGWAETEKDARQWLAAHGGEWDLAIIDLFLKQGSGLGVLEACQARDRGQHVVVLSNYATADMRRRCAQLGADAVFDKSNEIDALVEYCLALGEQRVPRS